MVEQQQHQVLQVDVEDGVEEADTSAQVLGTVVVQHLLWWENDKKGMNMGKGKRGLLASMVSGHCRSATTGF